jgi:hypothetical protein
VKRFILALFVAFVAFPSVALAIPDNVRHHWVPEGDEQQALAPDPAASEFDWADAGVGAVAVTGLVALGGLGVIALRRKRSAALPG